MKNKKSIYKISGILVLLVFMLGLALTGCTAQNKTAGETTTPQTETTTAAETTAAETTSAETQSTEQLSEQPDKAKYDEYFTEFYLGKAPRGQQMPQIHPGSPGLIKTAVFIASEDQFCVVGTVKKAIPGSFSFAVYDTVAKKDFVSKTVPFPEGLGVGSFGWANDPIRYPTGKYEFKLYIDDALVAVVPFEVRADVTTTSQSETTTTSAETQSTEQLSEQPDKAKYDEYFIEFYLGKLPLGKQVGPDNIPVKTAVFIASEDEFCPMLTLKKDIPAGSLSIAVYDTVAKKDFGPKGAFPMALNVGGHGWADDPIEYPAGKYEYKLYIDDTLVVVVPFEVR
jgi:hypothetical protein